MIIQPISVPPLPVSLAAPVDGDEAFAEMEARFAAVTEEQMVAVNLDIPTMAMLLLNIHNRLTTLTAEAREELTHFDPEPIEKLPVRAMALQRAHTLHLAAESPNGDDLAALQESGNALRVRLHDDASYMVKRGFLDEESIESVKFQPGYRTIATDLMVLVTAVRKGSAAAAGKVIVEEGNLSDATRVANRLFSAVALRKQNSAAIAHATLRRQQAYSFVFNEYNTIRRIVSFLRWEQDDADDFAPSLFAGRRSPRRDKKSEPPPAPATPAKDSSSPAAPVAPAKDATEPKVPVGHQGGSPFVGG